MQAGQLKIESRLAIAVMSEIYCCISSFSLHLSEPNGALYMSFLDPNKGDHLGALGPFKVPTSVIAICDLNRTGWFHLGGRKIYNIDPNVVWIDEGEQTLEVRYGVHNFAVDLRSSK